MIYDGVTIKITESTSAIESAVADLGLSGIVTVVWATAAMKDNIIEMEKPVAGVGRRHTNRRQRGRAGIKKPVVIYHLAVEREDVAKALLILDKGDTKRD